MQMALEVQAQNKRDEEIGEEQDQKLKDFLQEDFQRQDAAAAATKTNDHNHQQEASSAAQSSSRLSRSSRISRKSQSEAEISEGANMRTASDEVQPTSDINGQVPGAGGKQQGEGVFRRARSRGRTPSEMLARKQQLLGNNSNANGIQPSQAAHHNSNRAESAESKLESLSVLLKLHAQTPDELQAQQLSSPVLANNGATGNASLRSIDDVYILLAKKEQDLQLAAELGKVLLERNDELSKANERIAEDYSHKLELLEQEKHKLKRKLDLLDGEYENRLLELQTDCNILKNKLEQQQQLDKQAERERSKQIGDLVQQNQRLTSELAEATKSEELLAKQLEQLNERLQARSSTRSDQAAQVEALQDELQVLNRRKQDLERRLKLGQVERSDLLASAEETGDKVLVLESLLSERDLKLGELALEISELRDSSSWLSGKLESMISLNERLINCDNCDNPEGDLRAMSERERSHLVEQLKELRLRRNSRIKANEMILQKAAERQRRSLAANGNRRRDTKTRKTRGLNHQKKQHRLRNLSGENSLSDLSDDDDREDYVTPISNEDLMSEVFDILSELQVHLMQRKERLMQQQQQLVSPSSGSASSQQVGTRSQTTTTLDDSGIGQHTSSSGSSTGGGESPEVVESGLVRWRQLATSVRLLVEELPCSSCHLMISERADYEQLRRLHGRVCEEIRLKNDELLKLCAENLEQRAQLSALEERNQLLQTDLDSIDKPRDEIIQMAWKARDEAVGRKNNAEIQLAKTRIENMQVSSQLMEVVQQKGALSQRLAQFEDDIHYMTQRSVRARFSWEEQLEAEGRRKRITSGGGGGGGEPNGNSSSGFQQLLSLSTLTLLTSPKRTAAAAARDKQQAVEAPAEVVPLGEQSNAGGKLLANFKTARFNFNKLWQRGGSQQEQQPVE